MVASCSNILLYHLLLCIFLLYSLVLFLLHICNMVFLFSRFCSRLLFFLLFHRCRFRADTGPAPTRVISLFVPKSMYFTIIFPAFFLVLLCFRFFVRLCLGIRLDNRFLFFLLLLFLGLLGFLQFYLL